jgi:hypothetical protein
MTVYLYIIFISDLLIHIYLLLCFYRTIIDNYSKWGWYRYVSFYWRPRIPVKKYESHADKCMFIRK